MFFDAYKISNCQQVNFPVPFESHVAGGHGNGHCGYGIIHYTIIASQWFKCFYLGERFGFGIEYASHYFDGLALSDPFVS